MSTLEEIRSMLEDCEARESQLSDYERKFVDDMVKYVAAGRRLNDNQDSYLERIWDRVTESG